MTAEREKQLQCLSELRTQIEGFGARRAAERAKAGAPCHTLHSALKQMEDAAKCGDYESFHQADWLIHREIMELADVLRLPEAWQVIADGYEEFSATTLRACFPDLKALMDDHRLLVESICAGAPDAAHDAAITHLEGIWYRLAQRHNEPLRSKDPLQRATAYLAFHYTRPVRLATVARNVAFISPGQLSRLFRKRYGIGFAGYLKNLRFDKAVVLLQSTRLPVAHIVRQVGGRDPSQFGRQFKRRFGKTPGAYRKQTEAVIRRRVGVKGNTGKSDFADSARFKELRQRTHQRKRPRRSHRASE